MIHSNKPYLTGEKMIHLEDAKKNSQQSNDVSNEKLGKIYFGGLNELRAIAALGVVAHHIEQFKGMNGLYITNPNLSFLIYNLGKAGVDLFFVLSGFLITYLLLLEKENNFGRIDILKFYLRRIFRIWPLYYLIMFISFVVIPILSNFSVFEHNMSLLNSIHNPDNYSFKTIALYLSFLPQFANVVIGASQSWSIGVEEQFYLIMPITLSFFSKNAFFVFLLILLGIYFIPVYETHQWFYAVTKFFRFMIIGVIGGYLYFYNLKKISNLTKSKYPYFLIVILIISLSFFKVFENSLNRYVLGVLFLFLILFTVNSSNKLVFKNKVMSYLGKISYGIYMYHTFVLFLIFPFANKYFLEKEGNIIPYTLFLYLASYSVTILISIASYEWFESKFIRFKDLKYKVK
jgi:peptidoglycan/LPS O-acetylase OafA/YrhL